MGGDSLFVLKPFFGTYMYKFLAVWLFFFFYYKALASNIKGEVDKIGQADIDNTEEPGMRADEVGQPPPSCLGFNSWSTHREGEMDRERENEHEELPRRGRERETEK